MTDETTLSDPSHLNHEVSVPGSHYCMNNSKVQSLVTSKVILKGSPYRESLKSTYWYFSSPFLGEVNESISTTSSTRSPPIPRT